MLEKAAIAGIRFYRAAISPLMPAACRYRPSCSEYALAAIEAHGVRRGGWLAVRRIFRCHPFGGRGWDPVPPAEADGSGEAAAAREDEPTETERPSFDERFEGYGY